MGGEAYVKMVETAMSSLREGVSQIAQLKHQSNVRRERRGDGKEDNEKCCNGTAFA